MSNKIFKWDYNVGTFQHGVRNNGVFIHSTGAVHHARIVNDGVTQTFKQQDEQSGVEFLVFCFEQFLIRSICLYRRLGLGVDRTRVYYYQGKFYVFTDRTLSNEVAEDLITLGRFINEHNPNFPIKDSIVVVKYSIY